MEGITNIEKTNEDIQRCKEIVKEVLATDLTEEMLEALTIEVMDTALFIGGDFANQNIQDLAVQYKETGAVERFKRNFGGQ